MSVPVKMQYRQAVALSGLAVCIRIFKALLSCDAHRFYNYGHRVDE